MSDQVRNPEDRFSQNEAHLGLELFRDFVCFIVHRDSTDDLLLPQSFSLAKNKICVFPVTRPTLIFPSDPKVFIGIPPPPPPKKMKFYHTQPTLFAAIFFIGFTTFAVIFEAVLLFKHLYD